MCDAEDLSSVNIAYELESSFTGCHVVQHVVCNFWNFLSNSEFLRWHESMSFAKWTDLIGRLNHSINHAGDTHQMKMGACSQNESS